MTPTELHQFQRHHLLPPHFLSLLLRLHNPSPRQFPRLHNPSLRQFPRLRSLSPHLSQVQLLWLYRMLQLCSIKTLLCLDLIANTLTSTILPHLAQFPINLNSLLTFSWIRVHLQRTASKFTYESIPMISILQLPNRARCRLHLVKKLWMQTELKCSALQRHALSPQDNPLHVLTSFQERVKLFTN